MEDCPQLKPGQTVADWIDEEQIKIGVDIDQRRITQLRHALIGVLSALDVGAAHDIARQHLMRDNRNIPAKHGRIWTDFNGAPVSTRVGS